jgi:sulfite reductase beta subunit-like hemoprotein
VGLTLEAEQRMDDAGVVQFYQGNVASWTTLVRDTKTFVAANFPAGALIRRDDVAKALHPILEVHEGFKDYRNQHKLRAKYWIKDFADLLVDRTWNQL